MEHVIRRTLTRSSCNPRNIQTAETVIRGTFNLWNIEYAELDPRNIINYRGTFNPPVEH